MQTSRVLSTNSPDVLAPEVQVAALRLGARSSLPPFTLSLSKGRMNHSSLDKKG